MRKTPVILYNVPNSRLNSLLIENFFCTFPGYSYLILVYELKIL